MIGPTWRRDCGQKNIGKLAPLPGVLGGQSQKVLITREQHSFVPERFGEHIGVVRAFALAFLNCNNVHFAQPKACTMAAWTCSSAYPLSTIYSADRLGLPTNSG